jgi:hypothetical protein
VHDSVAVGIAALAALFDGWGKFAEAESLYHRALAIKEKIFGCDNVEVALTANNLGVLYKAQAVQNRQPCFSGAALPRVKPHWVQSIRTSSSAARITRMCDTPQHTYPCNTERIAPLGATHFLLTAT